MIGRTAIAWGHNAGYSLHIGRWDDPDRQVLDGFDSWWDAWAFAVTHGLPDPLERVPAKNRRWTNSPPPPPPPEQYSLFEE